MNDSNECYCFLSVYISMMHVFAQQGDFKNTQKFHWVADSKQSKTITIVECDHMLNKKTIDEEDNFEDFLTSRDHPTKVAYEVSVCNACDGLKVDDIIQLERRGFYRCDRAAEAGENAIVILVPDGKIRSMSKVTGVLEHK